MKNDVDYLQLVNYVLRNGVQKPDRTGVGMIEYFGCSITFETLDSVALLSRKIHLSGVIGELCAFIKGQDKLQDYKDQGCNYWDENAKNWGPNKGRELNQMTLGRVYGVQWRNWQGPNGTVDQFASLIEGLRKDPHSRRHVMTCWNPGEMDQMCLPPCHIMCQFTIQEGELHCAVYMRSVDLCLGLPSDMLFYSLLVHYIAAHLGLAPGKLCFAFGSAHIYNNHADIFHDRHYPRLRLLEHDERPFEIRPSPGTVEINTEGDILNPTIRDIRVVGYSPMPAVNYPFNL